MGTTCIGIGMRGNKRLLRVFIDIPERPLIGVRHINQHTKFFHSGKCFDTKFRKPLILMAGRTVGEYVHFVPCQHSVTDSPRIEDIQKIHLSTQTAEPLHAKENGKLARGTDLLNISRRVCEFRNICCTAKLGTSR